MRPDPLPMQILHSYSTTGPGGSYIVVMSVETRGRKSAKRWHVSIWRQDEVRTRWSWLPWVGTKLIFRAVSSDGCIRRLIHARAAFELMKAQADMRAAPAGDVSMNDEMETSREHGCNQPA